MGQGDNLKMRFALALSLFLIGCANAHDRCGGKYLIPWPNAEGRYTFQEVPLTTLPNPYRLSGEAAEVYSENVLTNEGFNGPVAEPHFTRSGDVCVPTDTASSATVSAYAQMEKLYDFERALGSAGQIKWPRKVGVNVHLTGRPIDVVNNAHYYGEQDAMALVPYDRADLPTTFNLGIVAHEHFHAHFQAMVYDVFNASLKVIVSVEKLFLPDAIAFRASAEDLTRSDPNTPRGRNNYVLRGWNEGLADFFAAIYTGSPDFFAASLPEYGPRRHLNLPLARLGPSRAYYEDTYGQGALLARALFAIAHKADRPPEAVLRLVLERLPDLPRALMSTYGQTPFEADAVLPILLRGLTIKRPLCDVLKQVMSGEALKKGFAACAS